MGSHSLNPKIIGWLNAEKFHEALSGIDAYFIMDVTFRDEHDVLTVLRVMLLWAANENKTEYCASEFAKAVSSICKEDSLKALDILNSYLIVSKDVALKLPIDFDHLSRNCAQMLNTDTADSNERQQQKQALLNALRRELTEFGRR